MAEDYAWMAKAFLLYILGVYLFANGGQIVSLRWLAIFHNFEDAGGANWGQRVSYLSVLIPGYTQLGNPMLAGGVLEAPGG